MFRCAALTHSHTSKGSAGSTSPRPKRSRTPSPTVRWVTRAPSSALLASSFRGYFYGGCALVRKKAQKKGLAPAKFIAQAPDDVAAWKNAATALHVHSGLPSTDVTGSTQEFAQGGFQH